MSIQSTMAECDCPQPHKCSSLGFCLADRPGGQIDLLNSEPIVSADRSRVIALLRRKVDAWANCLTWPVVPSVAFTRKDDGPPETHFVEYHKIEVDYEAGRIRVWRYVGPNEVTAFDGTNDWFEKL
jgi:hypothetical protein